jgi:two-component system, cell cycle sensor histidine kinase and response regulator CckA
MLRGGERPSERWNTSDAIETNKGLRTGILREQIRLAMKQIPTMQGASLIVALILCYVVRDIVPYANILGWVTLVLLTVLSEILLYLRFSKVSEDSFTEEPWENAYLILALISGVIWGLSAFVIFPAGNRELISLFVLVMGTLAATTTISHSSMKFAPMAWVGPAALFYVIRLAMEGGEFGYTLDLLIFLYLLTVLSYSAKHRRFITSAIALKFENLELLGEVRRVNDSLYQEIGEREIAQESLRESEEKFRLAFQGSLDSIIINRASDGMFLDINDGFTRMTGYTLDDAIGKTPLGLNIWYDHQDRKRFFASLRNTGSVENFEAKFCGKDGRIIIGLISARILHVNQEDVILNMTRDITELKRAEEERLRLEERLQRAEKMEALGTLAGGVAHDLNNVLGIVVGYSELLVNDSGESGSARSKAMEIFKGGQRAAAIVQDLLTLARRGVFNRKVLNLNNIVLECQSSPEFAGVSSLHPNIRIKTELEACLLNVSGSDVHLGKSLLNLVSNAAEAMPEGGVITIKTGIQYLDKPLSGYDEVREGDYVVLSISDTGEGIPAPDLKRIFEPFYTKKVMGRSGTGLGLAVVWGTVKDHQGYINVESEEGKGTTFTLYFPVTREDLSPEKVSVSASEYMGNGECVLVVDDVKEQRELASAMLTKLNYKAPSVPSGEEAVEYMKEHTFDLVVLDMIMDPGMDGRDTYAKILETNPHQRAIIVSGFSETERVSRAQALGAGTYVKKPYVLEKLGLAVRKELDRPA